MNINDFRANLIYGGFRPTHFQVHVTNPISQTADIRLPFLCRAAQLPSSTFGKIEMPYFGRRIPLPGDRVYEDWTTTVINDEDFLVKDALETWHAAIKAPQRNVAIGAEPALYTSQATVKAFSKNGSLLRTYQFNNIWPMTIAGIEADWGATDTVSEFQVVWAYTDWVVVGGRTGDAGGA